MDESEDNMGVDELNYLNSPSSDRTKSKKKSLVYRDLETNVTSKVTTSISNGGNHAICPKNLDMSDTVKVTSKTLKSPKFEKSPVKLQSPVYKMHASNSPLRMETTKKSLAENKLETQIKNKYNENISLNRLGSEKNKKLSPEKKLPVVYLGEDTIQSKEKETVETTTLIKNMFSPVKVKKPSSTHLGNILERSTKKSSFATEQNNDYLDTSSVVKTLDFDGNKNKKNNNRNSKILLSKSDIFEMEAKCEYQVGDLVWARMRPHPFWPCIITRDTLCGTFVKKKLFGRIEHNVFHVTFLGDSGRRGWIVYNMLRKFSGLDEFETTRKQFTSEAKKRDPRLYAAFFITEKKQSIWKIAVEEAEALLREPKRLRIDILRDMLEKSRTVKTTMRTEKSGKVTGTNSDVSLSESLYDTLFSEGDSKNIDGERSNTKTRNKSLNVSEVVTACLDSMAAKTGITKIQRQSHMDRWLQKAKSKTPEQSFHKVPTAPKRKKELKPVTARHKSSTSKGIPEKKSLSVRRNKNEHQDKIVNELSSDQNEHDYSKLDNQQIVNSPVITKGYDDTEVEETDVTKGTFITLSDNAQNKNLYNEENMLVSDDEPMDDNETSNSSKRCNIINDDSKGLSENLENAIFDNNETFKENLPTHYDDSVNDLCVTEEISSKSHKVLGTKNDYLYVDTEESCNVSNIIEIDDDNEDAENSTDDDLSNNTYSKDTEPVFKSISDAKIDSCVSDTNSTCNLKNLDTVVNNEHRIKVNPASIKISSTNSETLSLAKRIKENILDDKINSVVESEQCNVFNGIDENKGGKTKFNDTLLNKNEEVYFVEKNVLQKESQNVIESEPVKQMLIENNVINQYQISKETNTKENCLIQANETNSKEKTVDNDDKSIGISDVDESTDSEDAGGSTSPYKGLSVNADSISLSSERCESPGNKNTHHTNSKQTEKKTSAKNPDYENPEFLEYLEDRQYNLIDTNLFHLSQDEITSYMYNTWLYSNKTKSTSQKKTKKNHKPVQPKKATKKANVESKVSNEDHAFETKSKRKIVRPYYNEDYLDFDDDSQMSDLFQSKSDSVVKSRNDENCGNVNTGTVHDEAKLDSTEVSNGEDEQVEEYFNQLTKPKPQLFRGLIREKVCEICEKTGNLVKCKNCHFMFHIDCTKKDVVVTEVQTPSKGRKKKKKRGRKRKNFTDSNGVDLGNQSDEKLQDAEENSSFEDIELESRLVVDAESLEMQLSEKMRDMLGGQESEYYSDSSVNKLNWSDTEPGKCEIIDIKLPEKNRDRGSTDSASDFKCNNCMKCDIPLCFVCKSPNAPENGEEYRQRCQVSHCQRYYHLKCLEHWPQTQFTSSGASRNNKNVKGFVEALTCPRHVCHTCVSDNPRGCKTRFSGDKLARCVRCPATYHTFTKCIPAGTQILSGSHIICPRHYENRPGKVPSHVNTGWCFICALGGTLICCEYCPTSFHAECLNIEPPEDGYMCEECETGRLPLYGEMVWVKLGHYRWWPGLILHPSEIPANIMAVKHSPGEFVVRFFGQYDHYWVNRGRVFPFQEGDDSKTKTEKSKLDVDFNKAIDHVKRACKILKNLASNNEESMDFASSLLPPHYIKLKVNKPCGSLCGKRVDAEESSFTRCECNPDEEEPCGPYSQCLNRMLLTECGPICRAGDRCNNRAFEKRLYPKLVPYRTSHRGWGLKTLEDIKAGQFVIEYVGELIDEEEFQRRMNRKCEMRDENYYFLTLDKDRMIDAGPKGNLARFMNHCCEPNCETQKWTVLGDVRVGLFAKRDIPANTEVTFNYNLQCAGIEKKHCMCGAKRCSGYIGAKPKQTDPQPKKIKKVIPTKKSKKRKIVEVSPPRSVKAVKRTPRPQTAELSEIEKDLLIIKNATSGISSDSECNGRDSVDSRETRTPKRRKLNFSIDKDVHNGESSNS